LYDVFGAVKIIKKFKKKLYSFIFCLPLLSILTKSNNLNKLNMKKIIFFIATVFLLGTNCFAQNESKFKSLKDNLDKNATATQHPKKGIDPKTWMDRGKFFHEAYNVNVGFMRFGLAASDLKLFFMGKDPLQILSSEVGGILKETYEYNQINVFFENGFLKSWEETKKVADNALSEAVKAYQKAAELDEKGKNTKKINEAYKAISNDLETRFFNEYTLYLDGNPSKVKEAYNTALERIEVNRLLGISDTSYYFYAGFMAYAISEKDNSMWQQTIVNLTKALELGFREEEERKGQIYELLFNAHINIGDSAKALSYAQTGFQLYPNYDGLMYNLINYYIWTNETHKTLEYLEQAVARDSKNPLLLFSYGRVLEEFNETEKSLAAYNAAIDLDPDFFDAYFNKAVLFYNTAVKMMEEADEERVQAVYEAKMEKVFDEFAKAIPHMEKAYSIKPNDVLTMETLRSLYFRLRTKFPEMEAKYHEVSKKLGKEE